MSKTSQLIKRARSELIRHVHASGKLDARELKESAKFLHSFLVVLYATESALFDDLARVSPQSSVKLRAWLEGLELALRKCYVEIEDYSQRCEKSNITTDFVESKG